MPKTKIYEPEFKKENRAPEFRGGAYNKKSKQKIPAREQNF